MLREPPQSPSAPAINTNIMPHEQEDYSGALDCDIENGFIPRTPCTKIGGRHIIEILSSDDEFHSVQSSPLRSAGEIESNFGAPNRHAAGAISSESEAEPSRVPANKNRALHNTPRFRRVVQSSSEDDSDSEPVVPAPLARPMARIVDLTTSSSESDDQAIQHSSRLSALREPCSMIPDRSKRESTSYASLHSSGRDEEHDEHRGSSQQVEEFEHDSVLILDEPRIKCKPIRRTNIPTEGPGSITAKPVLSQPNGHSQPTVVDTSSIMSTPQSTARRTKTPRMSKKALLQTEQKRREAYARELFDELNEVVFRGGIPSSTQLRWNNRLLTTAGKAKYHRSRDGVQTSEIELATKILDCDERIRNTLSHEMCHLACWIINNNIKESHGKIFKGWAAKVMRARPDIEVSTTHSYEIAYKFEWKCGNCAKIYGRHTRSIRPDECVCGVCRIGKLIPLFETSQRGPKTPAKNLTSSQQPTSKVRDSPARTGVLGTPLTSIENADKGRKGQYPSSALPIPGSSSSPIVVSSSDEEDDVRRLAEGIRAVTIGVAGHS
ncbi:hypothetical protein CERSUDRAFT_110082 [Gelatoporia subvermispora B]|uniref:SprT-like domain-containing protein n=1 Tax=Ceriporiopsis subvermispora (strain B) TaxID=914234 RepID=M2RRL9_CERS8|nr:hypothetical protein CERSUDRAFT_110082 [Gelatoporia subvermispora B]